MPFSQLPADADLSKVKPFTIRVPQDELERMVTLIRLSKIAPATYENTNAGPSAGISRDWIIKAQETWLSSFDWRDTESKLNSVPNFKAKITDEDQSSHEIHFVALFSQNPRAVPILLSHGWPGSFLEFIPLITLLKQRFGPSSLPFHIVVPSIPGYAFSSGPPTVRQFEVRDVCRLFDKTMALLGFGNGYVTHGGDIGSRIARELAAYFPPCKAVHVNYLPPSPREGRSPEASLSESDQATIARGAQFIKSEFAYGRIQATKPATAGLALAASPISLLAWIGEKMLAWSDPASPQPDMHTILEEASLYFLTDSIARGFYPYVESAHPDQNRPILAYISKPLGYSVFPMEIVGTPRAWAELEGNLVFYKTHERGGHFAALEQPERILEDLEEFVKLAWKSEA